jgi:tetratricopeptide (TPR) repeat protein
MSEHRYRAFLCYSHRDSDWADWLHAAIESYPIPPRLVGIATGAGVVPARLAPVFRDRDELPSAANLSAKVSDALAQSANLIVICSPHAAQSRWVNEEVMAFQRLGRSDRIFCLIVDGEPSAGAWAGREHDECIPPTLTQRFDAEGRETGERLEPIAADARPGKDGKANALTKLVAGLLGVDFDDLRHRERRRRRLRATLAMAAGFALLCLTSALAVNAILARHAAERRQKQAEDLVAFMLGDLDDRLREVNRLDILESVADKAVKYFAALPLADMTDDTLAQHAKALLKIGAVRRDQGRVDEAIDAFKLAADSSERLVEHAPGNAEYEAIHAESQTWLGFIDFSQGRLGEALVRFVAARDILDRARLARPSDVKLLDQLAIAHSNAGRVFEAREAMSDARREYLAVVQGYETLTRLEPDKLDWKAELGYAHGNLAQLALKEGRLEDAVVERIADERAKASLAAVDPTNNNRREDLAAADAALGEILLASGALEDAYAFAQSGAAGVEGLLAVDPTSTDWLQMAGDCGIRLARIERMRGHLAEAARLGEAATARLRGLTTKDASNVVWQRKLAQAEAEHARLLLAQRRVREARDEAHAADAIVARSVKEASEDHAATLLMAELQLLVGDAAKADGDDEAARRAWSRAESILAEGTHVLREPGVLDTLVRARLALGRANESREDMQRLATMGYAEPDYVAALRAAGIDYAGNSELLARIAAALGRSTNVKSPAHGVSVARGEPNRS